MFNFDTRVHKREPNSALPFVTYVSIKKSTYCLGEHKSAYDLLENVQIESLETRFARYRQLCGGSFHVSIRQIKESDKKRWLKMMSELDDIEVETAPVAEANQLLPETQFRADIG